MAPSQTVDPVISSDKMSPTQENKPPIPTGAGAKKAMEAYFAGNNHMEFRQRSSSSSRTTRTFSRGATPSRDAATNAITGASGGNAVPEGAIDPDALKNALKKIPSMEKISIRPTPPRSRSISRSHSPLPDEELLDETLPDFYKVTLKPTERTGSQTRDILLGGNRLSRGATPTGNGDVPEFRRVALRRTPSREQLSDEQVHKRSTLKKNTVMEAASTTSLSRSSSFTSLTAINKTVHSKRNSIAAEDKPEFKGVVLKKTGSRPGSRSGSPTKNGSRSELSEGAASLKKGETSSSRSASRRGSAASESAEFANVSLKKAQMVKGDQSKFQVEQVSLKPIPAGHGEEDTNAITSEGWRAERASSVTRQRHERSSSVSRQRVMRETKFEANDEEYLDIKSSLDKLKKREATPVRAHSPKKDSTPAEDAAAKPLVYRRGKKLSRDEEEAEKVTLKPVVRKSAEKEDEKERVQLKPIPKTFTSSIECIKKAVDAEEDETVKRTPLLRKMSFTSSLDNIAVGGEEKEKVHLSCFSREMGSNVDLVQVCQEQGDGKHEVKLEFELGGNQVEVKEQAAKDEIKDEAEDNAVEKIEASCQQAKEAIEERLNANTTVDSETGEKEDKAEESEEEEEEEIREEIVTLHKIRKAPSIDGLFQRQDVQAAFTFTLPFNNEQPNTKLSLEIPNMS